MYITNVVFGRPQTGAEVQATIDYFSDPAVAPLTMLLSYQVLPVDPDNPDTPEIDTYWDNYFRAFSTEASADAYLAFVNAFTPAPQTVKKVGP